jgi:hypothetical protein
VIRDNDAAKQILEIKEDPRQTIDPNAFMSRCLDCKHFALTDTGREEDSSPSSRNTYTTTRRFKTCPSCGRRCTGKARRRKKWVSGLRSSSAAPVGEPSGTGVYEEKPGRREDFPFDEIDKSLMDLFPEEAARSSPAYPGGRRQTPSWYLSGRFSAFGQRTRRRRR